MERREARGGARLHPEGWPDSSGTSGRNLAEQTDGYARIPNPDQESPGKGVSRKIELHLATEVATKGVLGVPASYDGPWQVLGEVLVGEDEVPEEFFIPDEELGAWKYLKGAKSAKRTNRATGHVYSYNEGRMVFPDRADRPSRTIVTGEGGRSPSRFKHVVRTESGRYRRLTPLELEKLNMFPPGHTEGATDVRRAFLMGNALVVGVVERIGVSLAEAVAGREVEAAVAS